MAKQSKFSGVSGHPSSQSCIFKLRSEYTITRGNGPEARVSHACDGRPKDEVVFTTTLSIDKNKCGRRYGRLRSPSLWRHGNSLVGVLGIFGVKMV